MRLIDADALEEKIECPGEPLVYWADIESATTVNAVVLPCKVGDTVYGRIENYGKQIHECKVVKVKVCQFKEGSLQYFLDVEFNIIDPFFNDGRQMLCGSQVVFGDDFGNWDRVYLTREEAEAALAEGKET